MSLAGLHLERHGAGSPAVVFTHGFASSSVTWSHQVAALAEDHHVVAWDLRGHGRSPAPAGAYTREDALADLAAVVEAARAGDGGPALLVGHSLGGYLSLAHALFHPDTVAGLALVSSGPGFRNPDNREAYNRSLAAAGRRAGLPAGVTEVVRQRDSLVIDRLADIACSAVVIVGADDLPVYVAGAAYMAERLPSARLVSIDGAGHDAHTDRPGEVTTVLRAHAAALAGGGAGVRRT